MSLDRRAILKPETLELLNKFRNENTNNGLSDMESFINTISNIKIIDPIQKKQTIDVLNTYIKICEKKISYFDKISNKLKDYLEILDNDTDEDLKLILTIQIQNFKEFIDLKIDYETIIVNPKFNISEIKLNAYKLPEKNTKIINDQQRQIYFQILNIFHQPENYILIYNFKDIVGDVVEICDLVKL